MQKFESKNFALGLLVNVYDKDYINYKQSEEMLKEQKINPFTLTPHNGWVRLPKDPSMDGSINAVLPRKI